MRFFVPRMNKASLDSGRKGRSGMLDSPAGLLPVPIIITEPAVGYGGGLAVLYFHGSGKHRCCAWT
jgi:hypothetical protein